VLVWGGIVVLLVLVGLQARARFGYTMTLNALQDRIAQDEGPDPRPLLVSEIDQHLVGWPSQSRTEQGPHRSAILLSWRGLTSSYEITLPFDHSEEQPAVIGLETKDAPTIEEEIAAQEAAAPTGGTPGGTPGGMPGAMHGPGMHGAPGGGPPGPGGPGAGRDPMANDADGDGKLNREEAPGRLQENFDAADADGDGFLVLEEITAWREANPRPQTDDEPAAEGAAEEPGESTPAESSTDPSPAEDAAPEAGSSESNDSRDTEPAGTTDPETPAETTADPAEQNQEPTSEGSPEE
jgi:hypothetical protein